MTTRRIAGAVAGGLIAGLGITAMLMKGERDNGTPSELAMLERKAAQRVGIPTPATGSLPDAREQALIQGGHLLLSAAAGATYAAAIDEDAGVVVPGIAFGFAFYGAMHWLVGPLLGVKTPEWRADAKTIGMHTANHVAFGLLTAVGAKLATKAGARA